MAEADSRELLQFIGPDGVLEVDLDEMRSSALRAAARIAMASPNGVELVRTIGEELGQGSPSRLGSMMRTLYSALVIEALAGDIFGPLLSYAQVRELDHDFLSELQAIANGHAAGERPDSDEAEQGSHDDGRTTVDRI